MWESSGIFQAQRIILSHCTQTVTLFETQSGDHERIILPFSSFGIFLQCTGYGNFQLSKPLPPHPRLIESKPRERTSLFLCGKYVSAYENCTAELSGNNSNSRKQGVMRHERLTSLPVNNISVACILWRSVIYWWEDTTENHWLVDWLASTYTRRYAE